ncbi:MAG: ATP synthase F0 subunit B [Acidobacteria bacterium]|nr:ATP synthase F0 subunit B [Acidobacteriota bacterium]MDW7983254.1 ATP synthase F0 subunit B [Acidobacteriota bacterium]
MSNGFFCLGMSWARRVAEGASGEVSGEGSILSVNGLVLVVVILVALLWFILYRLYFQPLRRVLEERYRLTLGRLQEAQEILKRVEREQARYEAAVREVRQYANRRMAEARAAAEAQGTARIEQARQEVRARIEEARAHLRRQAEQVKQALQLEIDRLALEVVQRILRRSLVLSPDQVEQIRDEVLRT